MTNSVCFFPFTRDTIDGVGLFFLGRAENVRIKKVINNNILCVVDEKGNEMLVTGKGLECV